MQTILKATVKWKDLGLDSGKKNNTVKKTWHTHTKEQNKFNTWLYVKMSQILWVNVIKSVSQLKNQKFKLIFTHGPVLTISLKDIFCQTAAYNIIMQGISNNDDTIQVTKQTL